MADQHTELDFSTVLASSVHDMKNSVGMLLASLEATIQEQPPQSDLQAQRFATLHYEASRINGELIQLLTLYRMQNHHLPVRVDQHYVLDVLEDQLARNHRLIEARQLSVIVHCDDELQWFFDADLLGCLVQNVLVNCVRYTNSCLQLSASIDEDMLCVSLADDGPGYPDHMRQRPAALAPGDEPDFGSGNTHLGLYFADRIAQVHQQGLRRGYIELKNGGPLGGGVFSVYLP